VRLRARLSSRSRASTLFLLGLYDELWSGVAVVAAPAVEHTHAFDHDDYTLWVFALPLLCSALIEMPLALASERIGQRRVLAFGMLLLSAALVLGASAQRPWLFSLALALAGAGSGAACAAAQGELIATSPLGGARAMSRWTAYAALGDALTPLLVAGLAWFGFGYRAALFALGLTTFAQALVYLRWPAQEVRAAEEEEAASLGSALRALARKPRLTLLLFASALCCLLDEVVVALVALRMRLDQAQSLSVVTAGSTAIALGGILGALLSDRLLVHTDARRVLIGSSIVSLVALLLLTQTGAAFPALLLLALLGVAVAPHHALIQAAAYEQLPGRPGLVNAALQLFVVVEIAAPLAVGVIAARLSLTAALLALSVQPLAVGWVALRALRSRHCDRRPHWG
jgi:MFS family permease